MMPQILRPSNTFPVGNKTMKWSGKLELGSESLSSMEFAAGLHHHAVALAAVQRDFERLLKRQVA